jgi:hypothetical protein
MYRELTTTYIKHLLLSRFSKDTIHVRKYKEYWDIDTIWTRAIRIVNFMREQNILQYIRQINGSYAQEIIIANNKLINNK